MFRQRIQNSKVFLSIWILTCLSKKQKVANALSAKTTANLHQNPLFLCRRMDVMLFTRKDQEEKKIENHDRLQTRICQHNIQSLRFKSQPTVRKFINNFDAFLQQRERRLEFKSGTLQQLPKLRGNILQNFTPLFYLLKLILG